MPKSCGELYGKYIVNQIPDFFLYGKFSFFANSPDFLHFKLALCICFVSEIVPGILEKYINFHCIYDFSVFVPGVMRQKHKLELCI